MAISNKLILERAKLGMLERKIVTLVMADANVTQIIPGFLEKNSDENYYHNSSLGKKKINRNKIVECQTYKIGNKIVSGRIILNPRNQDYLFN